MPHEPWHFTRRPVLKGAVLALAGGVSAGCEEERADTPRTPGAPVAIGSFHIVGVGMYEAFKQLRTSLKGADRDVLEKLIGREDLLIHLFLAVGRLPPGRSRGGKSGPASHPEMKQVCDFHPIVGRFARELDWDVVYDPEAAKNFEEKHRILGLPEVVLYHEIFGHVLPVLGDPKLMDTLTDEQSFKTNECDALGVENRYRKQIGLREVPPELIKCPSPPSP